MDARLIPAVPATAGPAADGITASLHRRLLEQLSLGAAAGAADETERHLRCLRCLHFMWRLSRLWPGQAAG